MAKFTLMHCVPHPKMHGLHGYREIIESIEWGLRQLGHEVSYALNSYDPSSINIVFGAQVLHIDVLTAMPSNTIIYHLEQLRNSEEDEIRPETRYCAKRFTIWEYSAANLEAWRMLGAERVQLVPIGYAPTLTRIPRFDVQDIDVLIYGMPGDKRVAALQKLCYSGINTMFVCGLYGQARDFLIARSKLVVNINLYDFSRIFEIARVSYLLANQKAVVAALDPDTAMEPYLESALRFTTLDSLVKDCEALLNDEPQRLALEQAGYQQFVQRDIRTILATALA